MLAIFLLLLDLRGGYTSPINTGMIINKTRMYSLGVWLLTYPCTNAAIVRNVARIPIIPVGLEVRRREPR